MIALDQKRFRDELDIALVDDPAAHLNSELAELDSESSGALSVGISLLCAFV